ncbi:MAG: indole-3-glycerol phosphate synthase [Flavobacteriales bacterium]|jgi:indole-3-glycerol phosphate synthase|tara:strand:+ start:3151 stop:3924 length:774 start_codon:yes stop_codon:yes gene_type:complete
MTILDKINANKLIEIEAAKAKVSVADLESSVLFDRKCISLRDAILNKSGIIAEFKRQSPSKGIINGVSKPEDVAMAYENAGVSAMSCLTDLNYFGGTFADLKAVRAAVELPVLRKDFMLDEYQLLEAKSIGADIILLIASSLSVAKTNDMAKAAKALGLNVLLEIHEDSELAHINQYCDAVGVNNRNLKTFEVTTDVSKALANKIPNDFIKVSESGISNVEAIQDLKTYGYQGFLIGENFMKTENPGASCAEFINKL